MADYLIASWPSEHEGCAARAERIRNTLINPISDWRLLFDQSGYFIAVKGCRAQRVALASGEEAVIIGDIFRREMSFGQACPTSAADFVALSRQISTDYWGAYVAALVQPNGNLGVFRDPIGMADCLSWISDGIRLVASNPTPWLHIAPPATIGIEWDVVGAILYDSSIAAEVVPLVGLGAVPPGTIVQFEDERSEAMRIWSPRNYYHPDRATAVDPAQLRNTVTQCVTAWIDAYPNCAVELSGGLDSAIVALAGMSRGRRIRYGINFFSGDFAGDERRFAREVARMAGRPLREIFMPVGTLSAADLDGMPVGPRPGVGSVTLFHDRLTAAIGTATDTTALLSGLGGDSIFFQHPTPMIATDPAFPRGRLHAYYALAAWCNVSVWRVAQHAWRRGSTGDHPTQDDARTALPITRTIPDYRSTWADDLHDLPPAKRLQIAGLSGCRAAFGLSWRSQAMAYIHPLLSQPIVEHAIGIDAYVLTRGVRDRAFAREAFSNVLPRGLIERQGKGSLTHFFGQCLAASVPFLRDFLLEGRLVAQGVLDGEALAPMLDAEFLMRYDCYTKLMSAIIVENWARVWEDRLTPIRRADPSQGPALLATCQARRTRAYKDRANCRDCR